MGNIIENEQFKTNLQQLLQNKKFKRTLKVIYKEKQGQLLGVQSCEIIDHFHTIRQRLDSGHRTLWDSFEHNCKIILDLEDRKRWFHQCKICSTKMEQEKGGLYCINCKQNTEYKLAFCLRAKIIDANSQDSYDAIMFEEASQYLSLNGKKISVKTFSNLNLNSQNTILEDANQQKSDIIHLLQLQHISKTDDFKIKKIMPQKTERQSQK
ncbi:unnamed protein product (macronuclear) [Paramecium tetraurelia]|uniref:Replication factor A C-terminal domain-containing protein n=1 Tax=Paramecium tetraurelia TaxID=5888 RepID=A0DMV0_PARTE|nr:uncharacterized protein GSPATT00018571001 [Paramecium tetraurelia]CAK84367.1 unnamed protein product [Paramecium tetraurelia]|eukprot:XP_001451764.1 hypothetical protein (macronuclear) [Paramecium tetraurelia strain d4-2]